MHTTGLKAAPSRAAVWVLVVLIGVIGTLVSATLLAAPGSDSNFSPGGDSAPAPQPSESSEPDAGEPPTGSPDSGRTSIFAEADQRMSEMVETRAKWHAPSKSPVAETIEVGLSIGDGQELRRQVEETLPDVPTRPGVPLRVGTDVSARLVGEPSDVSITPDDAIDASTGSDIALLWTWNIHPKHPAERLRLSAHLSMTVPGTEHILRRTLHLYLNITRTVSYTANQIFTNYVTWAAIAAATFGAVGWLWRRFSGQKQQPSAARQPPPSHSVPIGRGARARAKPRRDSRDPHDDRNVGSGTPHGSSAPRGRPQR